MPSKAIMIVTGHLGSDPEDKSERGGPTCSFSIATNSRDRELTQWWDVAVWGKQGENCMKYLHKGSLAQVHGDLDFREYEGKRYFSLSASSVMFLDPKPKAEERDSSPQRSAQRDLRDDDDVEF